MRSYSPEDTAYYHGDGTSKAQCVQGKRDERGKKEEEEKEKGYKGKSKLSAEEMEWHWKRINASSADNKDMCHEYAQREEKRMNLLEPLQWRMVILKDLYFLMRGER